MASHSLPIPTAQDDLADAERFELWAARCVGNERISESFRRLAAEARARAQGK
jgi:hypothetical protein